MGILNDTMVYINGGHGYPGSGHTNPLFTQAIQIFMFLRTTHNFPISITSM